MAEPTKQELDAAKDWLLQQYCEEQEFSFEMVVEMLAKYLKAKHETN